MIGTRSFGTDPYVVSEMTQSVVKGLEDSQVYACLKHFPGHGATSGDTHAGYAYTDKTLDELMQSELVPFPMEFRMECILLWFPILRHHR